MLDEHVLNLINADVDGELTPAESQELDGILESSAEARAMRAELLKLSNLLNSTPDLPPPSGLSKSILGKLVPAPKVTGFSLASFFSSFNPAQAGMAFAAGLLLTVGFYEMSSDSTLRSDAAGMVGTMVASHSGGINLLENNLQFAGEDFSGTVSLNENSGLYVLNFDLDSRDRQEIKVGLAHTGLSFGGFAETQSSPGKVIDTVAISGGTLRLVSQGRAQFAVFLRGISPETAVAADAITIDFSVDEGQQEGDSAES